MENTVYSPRRHFLVNTETRLKNHFELVLRAILGHFPSDANKLWNKIVVAYSGKDRYYHNFDHIYYMIRESQHNSVNNYVDFAIFMHDYYMFFDGSKQDEEKSASYADEYLQRNGLSLEKREIVKNLILTTKHTSPAMTPEEAIIADIDLLSLAVSEDNFVKNTELVRKEYAAYSDEIFTQGRKTFFKNFLSSREKIYQTELYAKYEKQARENIERYLAE